MKKIEIDKDFHDLDLCGIEYNRQQRKLRFTVSYDPLGRCAALEFLDISDFDTIHFGEQNVISYAEMTLLTPVNYRSVLDSYSTEGVRTIEKRIFNNLAQSDLSVILVPSNGATIFCVCSAFHKVDSRGHRIACWDRSAFAGDQPK